MANYYGVTRTNYFQVTDEEKFVQLINRCQSDDPKGIAIWKEPASDGTMLYGFACYGDIDGISEHEDDPDADCDYDYDAFIKALQPLLPDGEAILIMHAGHEKLRYVGGSVHVVTNNASEYVNLRSAGLTTARKLLNDERWDTKDSY